MKRDALKFGLEERELCSLEDFLGRSLAFSLKRSAPQTKCSSNFGLTLN